MVGAALGGAQIMDGVERVEKGRGHRDSPVDAFAPFAGVIAGKPLKVELANGGHSSAVKVDVALSNPVGGLHVECRAI